MALNHSNEKKYLFFKEFIFLLFNKMMADDYKNAAFLIPA